MPFKSPFPRLAFLAVSLASMLWGYRLMLAYHAPAAFNSELEDLSYGWYVPVFSLYVLWVERRKILDSLGRPGWGGLPLLVFSFFCGFLGARGSQLRFEIVGFALMPIALVWSLFGRRAAKQVAFPCLFLFFCIPLHSFLDLVTIHLRMLAVSVSYWIMKGVGVGVVREGTMLASATGSFSIDVASPCSGLRSLFAMMALTAGYAYFNHRTWLQRGLLFACSIPIAIVGNIVRILTIALVAAWFNAEFALGFYHDYSGYVVFITAIALMLAASGAISRIGAGARAATADGPSPEPRPGTGADAGVGTAGLVFSAAVCAAVVSAMIWQATTPEPVLCEPPAVAHIDLPGYTRQPLPKAEAEKTGLPADTKIDRAEYRGPRSQRYVVTFLTGGRDKSSVHRPELCLPSQGLQMSAPHDIVVEGRSWHRLDLMAQTGRHAFAYTFFNQEGFRTSSHLARIFRDVWDRSILNRIDRWVMVTVLADRVDERLMKDFLASLEGAFR